MNTYSRSESLDAVLDTQSILDWLHFADPRCTAWEAWRQAGAWRWRIAAPLRDELAHVLARGRLPAAAPSGQPVLAQVDVRALPGELPTPAPLPSLRCTDRDDQKFIDFALACGARWLVSRDKAVLKLRRRALALHGLQIVHPDDWRPAG
ncbi:PIN domain-containing protein [Ideonella alba]|uniref:PIN domain-containing protein n=1 Tax=Ideonella alba TaxID=2824118 RepID=A0A940Y9U0_9BURK|nr:PIN domain-containing protein [Ideonella alba]MBQ0930293.1 PIN domain-containing protein [Ideonella alba]